jgi:hypothetical protein
MIEAGAMPFRAGLRPGEHIDRLNDVAGVGDDDAILSH